MYALCISSFQCSMCVYVPRPPSSVHYLGTACFAPALSAHLNFKLWLVRCGLMFYALFACCNGTECLDRCLETLGGRKGGACIVFGLNPKIVSFASAGATYISLTLCLLTSSCVTLLCVSCCSCTADSCVALQLLGRGGAGPHLSPLHACALFLPTPA